MFDEHVSHDLRLVKPHDLLVFLFVLVGIIQHMPFFFPITYATLTCNIKVILSIYIYTDIATEISLRNAKKTQRYIIIKKLN